MCADWAVSIRRACGALRFDCSSYHYKSRRPDPAELKRRIKEICETRVRYGYRRVYVVLAREGWNVSIRKVYNVYIALGLQLRNKTPKRRVKAKLRDDRAEALGPNDVWAMDFVHYQLAPGKKLRILTIVDPHSRYCPATDVRFSYRGEDVVQSLERVCRKVGYPGRSESTMAANSSPATSISGLTPGKSPWTSHGPESRLTTASSRHSTASCAPNA